MSYHALGANHSYKLDRNLFVLCVPFLWRYADLECIHSQLKSSKVAKMAMLLEAVESSYSPAFTNMQQDVRAGNDASACERNEMLRTGVQHVHIIFHMSCFLLLNWLWAHVHLSALEEARDICTYLTPLRCFYEDVESAEFPDVRSQIGPLMHTVCLVWANSQYYSTPARLIVLLQETCNLLIQQVGSIVISLPSSSPVSRDLGFFASLLPSATLWNHLSVLENGG